MRTPSANTNVMCSPLFQEPTPYIRSRENPYFDGLLRNNQLDINKDQADFESSNVVEGKSAKFLSRLDGQEDSISSDIIVKPASGNSLSSLFPNADTKDHDDDNLVFQMKDLDHISPGCPIDKMFTVTVIGDIPTELSNMPLPRSAASFYSSFAQRVQIVESCKSTKRLNSYLKAKRGDINAGVPGKFLQVVISQDSTDVGSIASTITYAFYLSETRESDQFCIVPVLNMKRVDLSFHAEIKWLLDSCQIEESSLIFADEIDLSYYDLFGSLQLILLNGNNLPIKQEVLKEAVIEIFNCKKDVPVYPGVKTIIVGEGSSCSALIAERFALTSPEVLAGQGISRLLLAGILMDTANLSISGCTAKDKYMATLLMHGSGRIGSNGLYHILRYKMRNVSVLRVLDILCKDMKRWTSIDGAGVKLLSSVIGMSSIGMSIEELLAQEENATSEIEYFRKTEGLGLFIIVSGYYDLQKNFKREILIAAESVELMSKLLSFLHGKAYDLPLKVLHKPGLKDEMRAFEINKIISRKTIEHLLTEFDGWSVKG